MENIAGGVSGEKMPGVLQLFKQTYSIISENWMGYIRFPILLLFFSIIFWVLILVGGYYFGRFAVFSSIIAFLWSVLIGGLIYFFVYFWSYAAFFEFLTTSRKENKQLTFYESFSRVNKKLLGFFGTTFLQSLVTLVGFILFVIPGIIFMVQFLLSPYVYMNENIAGWNALKKSRQYISGRWIDVFARIIGLFVSYLIIAFVVGLISSINNNIYAIFFNFIIILAFNIVGPVFALVYFQLIYEFCRDHQLVAGEV